jgi:hypothetical protein
LFRNAESIEVMKINTLVWIKPDVDCREAEAPDIITLEGETKKKFSILPRASNGAAPACRSNCSGAEAKQIGLRKLSLSISRERRYRSD